MKENLNFVQTVCYTDDASKDSWVGGSALGPDWHADLPLVGTKQVSIKYQYHAAFLIYSHPVECVFHYNTLLFWRKFIIHAYRYVCKMCIQ